MREPRRPRVTIVGVCTSGKTTLRDSLVEKGLDAYTVAQEHSSVRRMWSLRNPDYVVLLNCTLEAVRARRAVYWGQEMLDRQLNRLIDAREHCDLYIDTSDLEAEETLRRTEQALYGRYGGVRYAGCDT
jgi:hypothetical protein